MTGASRGLGRDLVTQLLARGDMVAATTRSAERVTRALADADTSRLLVLEVDLADEAQVAQAVDATKARFGGLDVVVNNAGYGFLAAIEEVTDHEAREMFDVQIFGVWNVLRAVLPDFRTQRSGTIINVWSILGLTSFPGWGLYCAGKFALEGMTESLAAEVAEFDIKVHLVEPGYMRTDFLTSNSLGLPTREVDAYPSIREMTRAHQDMPGTQLGDPAKAAAANITVARTESAPLHQLLGSDSVQFATARVETLQGEIDAARELAVTTDIVPSAA
ncbi:SDR family NAD(P)-dependent oxidoreductase [Microbacterium mcarthurae (nom. nud.)]|uniref:SDR family NAD(P)-dependent oxidoreductase n=1 Tax=Microbacterium mcarthurae TaxID=3035918 RepID=A0ABW9GI91_9MICO